MDGSRVRPFVSTLAYRSVDVQHFRCVLSLIPALARAQGKYSVYSGDALLCRSRAIVASRFLDTGYDVLLTIDSDIVFRPEDAIEVCEQAHELGIVVGMYPCRSLGQMKPASVPLAGAITFGDSHTPVPIQWGATGFMAVNRQTLTRMKRELPFCHPNDYKFYPFYDPLVATADDGSTIYLSEDFAFCERARAAGSGIYVNPGVRLKHVGEHAFRLEDALLPEVPDSVLRLERPGDAYRYTVEKLDPVVAG